ncbi:hypothetical protein LIER_20017 [Lithospermum erythrorhizon]|uniref:Uncharacterized protein n=1 Tax=Lithospermum erythrorhizon TaxID=34254 RepID=A0AAV3QNK1_LITER
MENREDLRSILRFLPLVLRSGSLTWHPPVAEKLEALSKGPHHSKINTGEALFSTISSLRDSLEFDYSDSHARHVSAGYSLVSSTSFTLLTMFCILCSFIFQEIGTLLDGLW